MSLLGMLKVDSTVVYIVLKSESIGIIKHVTSAKIVVFAGGIDISKTETKDTVLIKNADDLMNYNKSEEQAMENVCFILSLDVFLIYNCCS